MARTASQSITQLATCRELGIAELRSISEVELHTQLDISWSVALRARDKAEGGAGHVRVGPWENMPV